MPRFASHQYPRLSMLALMLALMSLLSLSGSCWAKEAQRPLPAVPANGKLLFADHASKHEHAYGAKTPYGRQAFRFPGPGEVQFKLDKITPGVYRIGFLLRTGTTMRGASNNHLKFYDVSLLNAAGVAHDLGPLVQPLRGQGKYQPDLASGKPGSWANWVGFAQVPAVRTLAPGDVIALKNTQGQGGVTALWLKKITQEKNMIALSLDPGVPLNAYTLDQPPHLVVTLKAASDQVDWRGLVRIESFDLLSEQRTLSFLPAHVTGSKPQTLVYAPKWPNGVYRVDVSLVSDRQQEPEDESIHRLYLANAPAKLATDLPDDWPLATHISRGELPMPGFKWYRYFTHWATNNPAKGKYDWEQFDKVFALVKAVGGKLLIADDTAPAWTVAPQRVAGASWVAKATAYPPDDMNDLRAYLQHMVKRYCDGSGTLGGLEVWNEPNTTSRWKGTPEQMVEMAKIFRHVADSAPKKLKVVGIAVSAGNHQGFVDDVIDAGILKYLDVVSAHWYEEMHSYELATPINNLPLHVQLVAKPMHNAGYDLPIWNTESGIPSVERENGRLVPQDELNRRAQADPAFNPKEPWKIGKHWRPVSERRAAAEFVAGIVMLMDYGVDKTFTYDHYGWYRDGSLSLQWVSTNVLGAALSQVDYHQLAAVDAQPVKQRDNVKALAYRIGDPHGRHVTVAWSYLSDLHVGRSKIWQPWLDPVPVRVATAADYVLVSDLYDRRKTRIEAHDGYVTVPIGEEPVYIWDQQ